MEDCIFCKIVAGEIPADKVYENDTVIAFRDINPVAPIHTLIIPKQHIATVNDFDDSNAHIASELFLAASKVAEIEGVKEKGYRIFVNVGKGGGQVVGHVHIHLVAGADLREIAKKFT